MEPHGGRDTGTCGFEVIDGSSEPNVDTIVQGAVVSLQNVTQRYKKVIALDDVSLDIPSNKMIGLIGPDGVGKSTLLGMIAGVRKIQSGTVQSLGGDIASPKFRNEVASRIAYLP